MWCVNKNFKFLCKFLNIHKINIISPPYLRQVYKAPSTLTTIYKNINNNTKNKRKPI